MSNIQIIGSLFDYLVELMFTRYVLILKTLCSFPTNTEELSSLIYSNIRVLIIKLFR